MVNRGMMTILAMVVLSMILAVAGTSMATGKSAVGSDEQSDGTMTQKSHGETSGTVMSGTQEEQREANDTVMAATQAFQDYTDAAEENIPQSILRDAVGIMIVPDVIKAGLIVGGSHGTGVVLAKNGNEWSLPVFASITGGSLGAQVGVESSDLVLVFNQKESLDELMEGGDFTLGADASVVAGTTGAKSNVSTQDAAVIAYQNTNGLFAGLSLTGSVLTLDQSETRDFYSLDEASIRGYYGDEEKLSQGIVKADSQSKANLQVPPAAEKLQQAIKSYAGRK